MTLRRPDAALGRVRARAVLTALLATGFLAGCGVPPPSPTASPAPPETAVGPPSPTRSSPSGGLEVRVQDHEEAIDAFRALEVTIDSVEIHAARVERATSWEALPIAPTTLDLTTLVGGPYAVLFRGEAQVGAYDGVRLGIGEISGVLEDGSQADVARGDFEAFVDFEVVGGQDTVMLLDLVVLDVSEHGTKGYLLALTGASLVWE